MYITTAIAYPNGQPHIGHAYEYISTDALARYHRLNGEKVFFLTGTDEHGQKILRTAEKNGITPQELVDRNSAVFKDLQQRLNISYDRFIRTTDTDHYKASQELWNKMLAAGDIYKGTYAGWYATKEESYVEEKETTLLPDKTRIHTESGSPVDWVEESSYFFALSKYQDRLLEYYEQQPDFVLPHTKRNEIVGFIKQGLKDLSISRNTFNWGVPVPHDPDHVMYVWVDALTNYLTGVGYPDDMTRFQEFWPADIHVIGKDVSRFHGLFWPAFLWSAGLEAPQKIFVHGFVMYKGEKMSKSIGNVIEPIPLIETFGLDAIRYFFLREIPFGGDGSYSEDSLLHRINSDLANDLGNLAQRSLSMIAKNHDHCVPHPQELTDEDRQLLDRAARLHQEVDEHMNTPSPHLALESIWKVLGATNKYFSDQAPWTLKKTDPARQGTILYVTIEVVRICTLLVQWAMPDSAQALLDQLSVPTDKRGFTHLSEQLIPGTVLPSPQGVFPRITLDVS